MKNNELQAKLLRLEQENFALTQESQQKSQTICELEQENKELKDDYDEISNNSEILHENNCLRIANAKLSEDLCQHGISMREWREQAINYRSALEEIREKAQHCIRQDVCALCDYSEECAVPDVDGLVYDNNRLLIKLINEVLK